MSRVHIAPTFALALAALTVSTGCDPTVAGKNDVLRFRYDADDSFLPSAFATPLGTGLAARVEVFVDPDGGSTSDQTPAPVIDANSNDEAVVDVVATAGNKLTLLAKSAGVAEIRVETASGTDAFDVRVVDVARIDLQHPGVLVSDNPPSKGIVGGTARFIVALKDGGNDPVVGFGALPATVTPANAAVVLESEEIGFVPVRFSVAGAATLTAQGDDALELDIIADADVIDLELKGLEGPNAVKTLAVGGELATVLRGLTSAGDRVVGVASLATVTSSDPSVCAISPSPRLGEGAYLISAKAAGTCRVVATLGERATRPELTVTAK